MKALILSATVAIAAFFAPHAMAQQSVDLSGLTAEQQAAIHATVQAQSSTQNKVLNLSEKTRTEVDKWGELIVGAAVSGARQANMVVDEFSKTTVGKVTIAVVVYKIIGRDIIRMIAGAGIAAVGFLLSFWIWYCCCERPRSHNVKRERQPVLWGLYHKLSIVEETQSVSGDNCYFFGVIVVAAAGICVGAMVAFV